MGEAQSRQPVATPAAQTLEAELDRIAALGLDEVRALWREMTQQNIPGEQQPIVEKELFEAVQAKLKDRAVARKMRRSRSPSILSGILYDDRGNLMSPSHANKKGVRYRYYVSQAVLQNRKYEAGSIARVAAPDTEELVIAALRHQVEDIDRQVVPVQTSPQNLAGR